MNFCRYRESDETFCGRLCLNDPDRNAEVIVVRSKHKHSMIKDHAGIHAYHPHTIENNRCYFHQKLEKGLFNDKQKVGRKS